MFKKITPQRVQHRSGYIVQTGSRDSLRYVNGDLIAEVKADFGQVTAIYPNSLVLRNSEMEVLPSIEERELILRCITTALDFLGEKYELHRE
jgi:hypothetical protein